MDRGHETFYAEMKYESDGAYLFTDGIDKFWIPKSQIVEMESKGNGNYEVTIPHWLAVEKGIV